jgi:hypothetical protein
VAEPNQIAAPDQAPGPNHVAKPGQMAAPERAAQPDQTTPNHMAQPGRAAEAAWAVLGPVPGSHGRTEPVPASSERSAPAPASPRRPGPVPESPVLPEPPGSSRARRRHRWLSGVAAGVAVAVGVGVFVAASGDTQAAPPSTGCRDYYADVRAYTVGRMCWSDAEVTISGDLTNPAEPYVATVQVCVSNHPDTCARRVDLATADRGQTRKYHTAVRLPPGHGAWVRVCLDSYCTAWK